MALSLVLLASVVGLDEPSFGKLCVVIFVHNIFSSLQDVATDALAVDQLPDPERGPANGIMASAKTFGIAVGGAGFSAIAAKFGFATAVHAQVGLLLLIMMAPVFVVERPGDLRIPSIAWRARLSDADLGTSIPTPDRISFDTNAFLSSMASIPRILNLLICLSIFAYKGLFDATSSVFAIQELGWTSVEFAAIMGGPATMLGVAGSLLGGWLCRCIGEVRQMLIALGLVGLSYMMLAISASGWSSKPFVTLCFGVLLFADGLVLVSLFSLSMRMAVKQFAGTIFTLYMAAANLSQSLGSVLAGPLDHMSGNRSTLFLMSGLTVLPPFLLLGILAYTLQRSGLFLEPFRNHES
jgi:PAT family beta-lactamase induction signal transducer AmpG